DYLLGVCNQITLPRVPFQIATLAFFCSFTNARGPQNVELRVEHEATDQVVWRLPTKPIVARNPLVVYDLAFWLHRPTIQAFGCYWFNLYSNDLFVAHRRFFINPPRPSRSSPPAAPPAPAT